MNSKKEKIDEKLMKFQSYTHDDWSNFNYDNEDEQYTAVQKTAIQKIKNNYYQKFYGGKAEDNKKSNSEETENQSQTASDPYIAKLEAEYAEYEKNERQNFIMYHSFYEALEDIHGEAFEKHMRALCEYGLYKKIGDYKGSVKMFMTQVKPQIDANEKRRIKTKINGKKGGAPEGNDNARKR